MIIFRGFQLLFLKKDRAEYLVHTLRTCMIQDYPKFEIIVSDDCSEDNSVEIVRELAQRDSRIRLFAHEHHLGMRDNFEFALNQVKPGYVMALGGDDALLPGCIWRMYEILRDTGKQLLTWAAPIFHYSENGKSIFAVKRRRNFFSNNY
ncbi:glycosyltransferase [Bacteroides thetaiotaomicron]|nr:glycosyltransferase [Bacteroides thetaiotaomicron]